MMFNTPLACGIFASSSALCARACIGPTKAFPAHMPARYPAEKIWFNAFES